MDLTERLDLLCENLQLSSITCLDLDGCLVFSSSQTETSFLSEQNIFLEYEEKQVFIEKFKSFNLVFSGKNMEISKISLISKYLQRIVD